MSLPLQSESINELVAALVKAQAVIDHAAKNAKNPHFKSNYANLEAVIDATREEFAKCDLVVAQQPSFDGEKVFLVTTLAHKSGQWLRSYTPVINSKGDAQGMGSALTYARRYALSAMANIHQEDDDANKAVQFVEAQSNPIKVVRAASAKATSEPVNYVCTFGKYKGKKVGDIDIYELDNYLQFIEKDAQAKNKPIVGQVAEFVAAAESFLKAREPKPFVTGDFA